jgi:hypothetical protein
MDSIAKFNEALKAAKTRMDARRQLLAATRRCGFDT